MAEEEHRFTHINENNELETIDLNTEEVISAIPLDPHLALANYASTYIPYTVVKGETVCDLVRQGVSYVKICSVLNISRNAIHYWKHKHPDFAEKIKMARLDRADHYFDKVQEIAEEDHDKQDVPGKKLNYDAYKWMAEKSNPSEYGAQTKIVGDINQPLSIIVDTGISRNYDEPQTTEEDNPVAEPEESDNTIDVTQNTESPEDET